MKTCNGCGHDVGRGWSAGNSGTTHCLICETERIMQTWQYEATPGISGVEIPYAETEAKYQELGSIRKTAAFFNIDPASVCRRRRQYRQALAASLKEHAQ